MTTDNKPNMFVYTEGMVKANFDDILYFMAEQMYSCAYGMNQKRLLTLSCGLKDLEQTLPADIFLRINRSYIINLWKVQKVYGKKVIMIDGTEIILTLKTVRDLEGYFNVYGRRISKND